MSEEVKDVKDVETTTNTEVTKEEPSSNREWKSDPKTQKLIDEINTLRAERDEANKIAQKEAQEKELKEAEAKRDYEKALEILKTEKEKIEYEAKAQRLQSEMTVEILALNAPKDVADLALSKYVLLAEDERPPVKEFVKEFSEHPVFSALFGSNVPANRQVPPGTVSAVSGSGKMNYKMAEEFKKSDDPEKRKMGRDYHESFFREFKRWPTAKD